MSGNQIKTFEDLKCWKACRELRIFVANNVVPLLPKDEKYRLISQILDSARSTTANIAEGYGRYHYLDNAKFCSNSRGSCWEVLDHFITAYDEKLISNELYTKGRNLVIDAVRLVNGYMNYLRRVGSKNEVHDDIAEYITSNQTDIYD